ncbi:MAG: recombinase family protein [Pseudomonadota bacterium]
MNSAKALIYCRTTTALQDTPQTGCEAQEARCRAYAKDQNHTVMRVFVDQAFEEKSDRPGLNALLECIRANSGKSYTVIAEDPGRIHRSLPDLLAFRKELARFDAKLDCISTAGLRPAEAELTELLLVARAEWEDGLKDEEEV